LRIYLLVSAAAEITYVRVKGFNLMPCMDMWLRLQTGNICWVERLSHKTRWCGNDCWRGMPFKTALIHWNLVTLIFDPLHFENLSLLCQI